MCPPRPLALGSGERGAFLHNRNTLRPKLFVRNKAQEGEPQRIFGLHAIGFEVLAPRYFRAAKELQNALAVIAELEKQQVEHEHRLRDISFRVNSGEGGDGEFETETVGGGAAPAGRAPRRAHAVHPQAEINVALVEVDKKKREQRLIMAQLYANARDEHRANKRLEAETMGRPLKYGMEVMLRHRYSSGYISANTHATAALMYSHLGIEILPKPGAESVFRVLPRHKVRRAGDVVRETDHVVLGSVAAPGHNLSLTPARFSERHRVWARLRNSDMVWLNQVGDREASLSGVAVGWRTHILRPGDAVKAEQLYISDVVVIRHRESELQLTAANVNYKENYLHDQEYTVPLDEVVGKATGDGYERITDFFQLCWPGKERSTEPGPLPAAGEKRPVALRHMVSGKYLGVVEEPASRGQPPVRRIRLVDGTGALEHLSFLVEPIEAAPGDAVVQHAVCRIIAQHGNAELQLDVTDAAPDRPEGKRWDPLVGQVHGLPRLGLDAKGADGAASSFDNAFVLVPVEKHDLDDFYFLQGREEVFELCDKNRVGTARGAARKNTRQLLALRAALGELKSFLAPDPPIPPLALAFRRKSMMKLEFVRMALRVLYSFLEGCSGEDLQKAYGDGKRVGWIKRTVMELHDRTKREIRQAEPEGLLVTTWEAVIQVLLLANSTERTGVTRFLSKFFTAFAYHQIYLESELAGQLLAALGNAKRYIAERIVADGQLHRYLQHYRSSTTAAHSLVGADHLRCHPRHPSTLVLP